MMKRKLRLGALLSVSVLMLALLIGGLYGTFSDEETSNENTWTAGSLNLVSTISGQGYSELNNRDDGINDNITFGQVIPGATGNVTWTLTNQGTINGTLSFAVVVTGDEGGLTEPEIAAGDDAAASELIDKLTCTLYIDSVDVSGVIALSDLDAEFAAATLNAGATTVYSVVWWADDTAPLGFGNEVQTDTAQIDITFLLEQV